MRSDPAGFHLHCGMLVEFCHFPLGLLVLYKVQQEQTEMLPRDARCPMEYRKIEAGKRDGIFVYPSVNLPSLVATASLRALLLSTRYLHLNRTPFRMKHSILRLSPGSDLQS